MSAVSKQPVTRTMPYALRPLQEADVEQSAEIERDAFPTLYPPTSFRRELRNRLASYLVAWKRDGLDDGVEPEPRSSDTSGQRDAGLLTDLLNRARCLWRRPPTVWRPGQQFLVGFVGLWYMADEAHIVSIAVRRGFRGQGIGELLLIGAIEQALARGARVMTLEVRVSNRVAQNLYRKYGFTQRGVRKAYYTDNGEDALIMTTEPIQSQGYREAFRRLVRAHEARWGRSLRIVS